MITGAVTPKREARINLSVFAPTGEELAIDAIVDTGFNGFLTLHHGQIRALGLPHLGRGRAILANGSEAIFEIYEVNVSWHGELLTVEADGRRHRTAGRNGIARR